mgnify:CR=1 FL=1
MKILLQDVNKYFEYFDIDEGYYPEINESSIKDPKNKWQATFPHRDIVEILKLLERALSRTDKKSLWLEGSYGTGKSRILWMLQNLLTCSEKDFDAYFGEYENLKNEIDLRERLRTIRNEKVVTASRYATGDITSTQKLIFAVFESLTAALKKRGLKFDGAKTLRGKIANWLESDNANFEMFRAKIQKPEYRMSASLANRNVEDIIDRLKNPNREVSQLVEEILKLGEKEGIRAFNIDMTELIDWITEVLAENNLKALILFWDEFSKFFSNNRNNLDEFQRLAELSNIAPFYLVIATHETEFLANSGEQDFRIVSDRFNHKNITMPDNIAFELIGHALKIKKTVQNDWNCLSAALAERTAEPRQVVAEFVKIRDEKILKGILPIHPVAAIILKNLSTYFASNQRSIFNFIKNSDPNVEAFQDFIAKKSPINGDLLTVDCLWNFFYESGTDEHGGNVGRMNLKPSIRAILDSYALNAENLNLDEQVVLKTILIFQAIDQESRGDIELFHPTEKNIELAFKGVSDFENGRAVSIANDLARKDILFKKPGKITTFATMSLSGDFAEIERLKAEIAKNARTAELIASVEMLKDLKESLTTAQNARYIFQNVTADNFTLTINRLTNEAEDYHIKAVVCFARNEDEQNKIQNLLSGAVKDSRYKRLVFLDASSNLMNREIFNRWVENSANEKYWRGKDNALADKMKDNAADYLKEWQAAFSTGVFVYYPATDSETENRAGVSCQTSKQIIDELKDNTRRIFPYSFDDANIAGTIFQASNLKKYSEIGILQQEYASFKTNAIKIVLGDVWQISGKYWEVYPNLNISRLKKELDALIKSEIEKNIRISFGEIFKFLLERGFMPLNLYAFLTGFLLKEYAADPYRYSAGIDGNMGGAMSVEKLSECIGESIKEFYMPARSYRPKYLEIMSPNQRQFMEFTTKIFGVAEDVSVEQSAQKFRLKLKNLGYPFWCYVDAATDEYKDFLSLLAEISNSKQAVSISALAERAGQFLTNKPETFDDLKIFLTEPKGRKIFTDFIKNFEGGIIFELAQKIGMEDVVEECRRRITSGDGIWLRDKETAEEDLKKFVIDCKIIVESQKFGVNSKSFNSCLAKWKDFCCSNLKIPVDIISDYCPPLKNFFSLLKEIVARLEIPQKQRENFLRQLTENTKLINDTISASPKIFREKYSFQLSGLNDTEIDSIYSQLSYKSFTDSQGQFVKNLNELTQKTKKARLKNELMDLWQKIAGGKLPNEWSKDNRTPILIIFPKNEVVNAKKICDTINFDKPEEKDIQFAIDYLKKNAAYFAAMKDTAKIERAFREKILGEYDILLEDNNEIRGALEIKFSDDAYKWYPNFALAEFIKEFAKNKYYSGGAYDKLTEKIMQMPSEKAKEFLIKLLDKNFEVGLKILRES